MQVSAWMVRTVDLSLRIGGDTLGGKEGGGGA